VRRAVTGCYKLKTKQLRDPLHGGFQARLRSQPSLKKSSWKSEKYMRLELTGLKLSALPDELKHSNVNIANFSCLG